MKTEGQFGNTKRRKSHRHDDGKTIQKHKKGRKILRKKEEGQLRNINKKKNDSDTPKFKYVVKTIQTRQIIKLNPLYIYN